MSAFGIRFQSNEPMKVVHIRHHHRRRWEKREIYLPSFTLPRIRRTNICVYVFCLLIMQEIRRQRSRSAQGSSDDSVTTTSVLQQPFPPPPANMPPKSPQLSSIRLIIEAEGSLHKRDEELIVPPEKPRLTNVFVETTKTRINLPGDGQESAPPVKPVLLMQVKDESGGEPEDNKDEFLPPTSTTTDITTTTSSTPTTTSSLTASPIRTFPRTDFLRHVEAGQRRHWRKPNSVNLNKDPPGIAMGVKSPLMHQQNNPSLVISSRSLNLQTQQQQQQVK